MTAHFNDGMASSPENAHADGLSTSPHAGLEVSFSSSFGSYYTPDDQHSKPLPSVPQAKYHTRYSDPAGPVVPPKQADEPRRGSLRDAAEETQQHTQQTQQQQTPAEPSSLATKFGSWLRRGSVNSKQRDEKADTQSDEDSLRPASFPRSRRAHTMSSLTGPSTDSPSGSLSGPASGPGSNSSLRGILKKPKQQVHSSAQEAAGMWSSSEQAIATSSAPASTARRPSSSAVLRPSQYHSDEEDASATRPIMPRDRWVSSSSISSLPDESIIRSLRNPMLDSHGSMGDIPHVGSNSHSNDEPAAAGLVSKPQRPAKSPHRQITASASLPHLLVPSRASFDSPMSPLRNIHPPRSSVMAPLAGKDLAVVPPPRSSVLCPLSPLPDADCNPHEEALEQARNMCYCRFEADYAGAEHHHHSSQMHADHPGLTHGVPMVKHVLFAEGHSVGETHHPDAYRRYSKRATKKFNSYTEDKLRKIFREVEALRVELKVTQHHEMNAKKGAVAAEIERSAARTHGSGSSSTHASTTPSSSA